MANAFTDGCLAGIEVERARAAAWVEQSLALATVLVPAIGYDRAAQIAKEAAATGRSIREVAIARAVLPLDELERLLDVRAQTVPGDGT